MIVSRTAAWLLLAGLGGLALAGTAKASTPAPAPGPAPGPGPQPPPVPDELLAVLKAEVVRLLMTADADPNAVNPDYMDAAAAKIEPYDAKSAAMLREKAAQVRARRGMPPAPIPPILQPNQPAMMRGRQNRGARFA